MLGFTEALLFSTNYFAWLKQLMLPKLYENIYEQSIEKNQEKEIETHGWMKAAYSDSGSWLLKHFQDK